jgi:hypothetical protein
MGRGLTIFSAVTRVIVISFPCLCLARISGERITTSSPLSPGRLVAARRLIVTTVSRVLFEVYVVAGRRCLALAEELVDIRASFLL